MIYDLRFNYGTANGERRTYGTGLTLIEVVISLGLLLLIVGSVGGFIVSLQQARAQSSSMQEVEGNLRTALDIIGARIRASQGVNIGSSVLNGDPGVLSLAFADPARNPTIIRLDQDNGILVLQEGATAPVSVTTNEVRVTNLVFSLRAPSNEQESIGISLTLDYASAADAYTAYAHTTTTAVTLRQ